ncbi:MAG: hypothetical protein KUG69_00615 [Marinosulfonomonas sp.]|nr:hypothetical protein [Marinosulfonomonas sp.]
MTYEERANHISKLIETRLGVRGKTLPIQLRRAGRLLPRDMRRHAKILTDAVAHQASPKLARLVDNDQVLQSYEACENYLTSIDIWDRRKGKTISILSTAAFNLLAVGGLLIAVLVWRGYL